MSAQTTVNQILSELGNSIQSDIDALEHAIDQMMDLPYQNELERLKQLNGIELLENATEALADVQKYVWGLVK